LEVALSILLVSGAIGKVDRANLLRLLAGAVPGSLAGVFLLASWANRPMEIILGVAVIGVGLFYLRNTPSAPVVSDRWGLAAGFAGGLLGGMFGTSGPAYVAFLSSQALDKAAFRATLIVLFAVEYAWRLGLYAHQGLLDIQGLQLALTLLPALVAATLLGHFVHLRVGEKVFRRWVAVFLLVSGTVCLF
ncbi:MAG: sulfite exporter TauE/SafE family protein, partial [Acidobacteriota bacterium]|nr:sulfite exporter TauE/SafE family protein [Acidobacteriota bacterium]